ncbi:Bypass of stop codon protein 6 OS=Saccharomyces cerevisiae (strain ATCC 204508 / S288c) GN=BSC6 PE=1 SV=1 [Rhizoctonia solani AG-1 IB]|uniref:Bypass of stop codon protein 6 n=1 Tax=Thanatephorus cucumeris (strain AG1-IB / isolate 7/3/14) TaxID=1108050 RepID=A0A0B7FCN4_THACB|nr:Bypass of stop codon protein 6 OS=Saccharomyces cerevisiae (strain ATCC 204508 / S288c) GN=BSC6 PE=1 SV=1 [Rhizoctonia solani AG-1 IB]
MSQTFTSQIELSILHPPENTYSNPAEKEQYSSRGHPPDLVEYDSSMDSARLDTRASGLRVGNVFIEDKFIILLGSCAGVFAVGINDTAMGANLPSIQEHYNLSYDVLSIVFLAGFGGYLISCVLNSVLQSVIGIHGVLLMAGFWYATGAMLIAFAPPFPVVMIGLMLMGIGGGFYDTCLTGVISHFESTKLMNIFYSFFGFGSLVSPFIVGALAKAGIKWNVFYWVPFSIAVLVTLCHLVLFKNYKIPSEDENTEHQGAYGRLKQVTRMQIIWVGIPLTILGFAINNILGNWLTLYLMEVKGSGPDVSRYQLSVYWAGLTFGRVFFSLPFINVSERAGNTLLVAALSGAIGVFWGVNSVPLNWLMVGAAGFCLGPNTPGIVSIVSSRVPPSMRGIVISVTIGCGLIGATLGPLIFGVIVGRVGLKVLPPIVIGLAFLAIIMFWLVPPREKRD